MKILPRLVLALLLVSVSLAIPLQSLSDEEKVEDANADNVAAFQKMLDFVGVTKKLSVTVDSNHDALQESGQMLEFGLVSEWHIKRPDKVRVNIKYWDGNERDFYFDGTTITL